MGNCNSGCNGGRSCGCCLLNNFANAINNLFSTEPYCGCARSADVYTNGFLNGVNAANTISGLGSNGGCGCNGNNGNGGCGCNGGNGGNGGCGCNGSSGPDLSPYTACGRCSDAYYARQYALYPFGSRCGVCSCGG